MEPPLVGKLQHHRKVDEIPFDFLRRRMSVIVRNGGKNLLVCKGAIEEVLALCTMADDNAAAPGSEVPLSDDTRQRVREITRDLNEDGLRAVAIAYKWLPPVLAGYVAFLDPPKESAREAIGAHREHGVDVKIITGDNEVVTRKICREVGLAVEKAMSGKDVEALTDGELAGAAEHTTIFTKMSALEKSRVIGALRSNRHTVGYLGDGINDASALKDADVGISVDTAVHIAKESAVFILWRRACWCSKRP